MPDYDRQLAQDTGLVHPPTPDQRERAAIHCADQTARGNATEDELLEALHMLGVYPDAVAMAHRHHTERARTTAARAERAAVLELKTPRKKRRRAS